MTQPRIRVSVTTLILGTTAAAVLLGAVSLYENPPQGYLRVERYWRMLTGDVQPEKSFGFSGLVGSTAKGQVAIGAELRQLWKDHQFVLVSGKLRISGKFTRATGSSAIPKKLRFLLKQVSTSGATLYSKTFDMAVGGDGTIASHDFPLTSLLLVNYNEKLQFTVSPIDRNLPAGSLQLSVAFNPPAGGGPHPLEDTPTNPGTSLQTLQYTYGGYPGQVSMGAVSGRFAVVPLGTSSLDFQGKLTVKGRITPDTGTIVPSKIRAIIKHNDAGGHLLRTDKFDVKVKPNGTIASQSFAFTTINSGGIRESLDISFVPVDKDLPDCELTLAVTFGAA